LTAVGAKGVMAEAPVCAPPGAAAAFRGADADGSELGRLVGPMGLP
jgi:hypothetical protein